MRKIIGGRLEEERDRLKKKKGEMAKLGGVVGSAYTNYINGDRAPDAEFLAAIAAAGADVQYVLTGIRSINPSGKSSLERHLTIVKAVVEMAEKYNLPLNTVDRSSMTTQNIKRAMGYVAYSPSCSSCAHRDEDGITQSMQCTHNPHFIFDVEPRHSCKRYQSIDELHRIDSAQQHFNASIDGFAALGGE